MPKEVEAKGDCVINNRITIVVDFEHRILYAPMLLLVFLINI